MKNFTTLFLLISFTLSSLPARCQQTNTALTIGFTDSLYSPLLKEKRRLFIYMPQPASKTTSKQVYPVVYLLDGGINFLSFVGALRYLSEVSQVCPPMIVVAILNTDRMRDLTPTHITSLGQDSLQLKTSGGGETFTNFLEKELIPYIDAHYPTSPDRMLIGHSLGGLFAVNTFLYHTHLFKYYLSIDPSLTWDKEKVLKRYLKALSTGKFSSKSIFLTAANFANMDSTMARHDTTRISMPTRSIFAFADGLQAKNDSGLDWACRYFADESHFTVPVPSEYAALKYFFRKKTVQLTASQLKAMEGKYQFELRRGRKDFLQVRAKKDHLLVTQMWDGGEFELVAESELSFYCKHNPYEITFVKDNKGNITQALVMKRNLWTKVEN